MSILVEKLPNCCNCFLRFSGFLDFCQSIFDHFYILLTWLLNNVSQEQCNKSSLFFLISFKYRQIITVIFTVNLHIIFFTTIISNHNTSLHTSQHYFNWCSYWGFSRRCSQSKLSELIVSSVLQPVLLSAHVYQAFTECKFQHVFFNLTQFRLWAHIYTIMKAFTHIEIFLNFTDTKQNFRKKMKKGKVYII